MLTRKETIVFDHAGVQYGVGMHTNSRMLDTSFDSASKPISVRLEGVQGSAGMSEFMIPKEFMVGPFAVSLDGKLTHAEGMTVSENQTPATVALEHDHGLQGITI
jgi:hypothetical protein